MDNNELSGYDVTVKYTMDGMVKRERIEADVRKVLDNLKGLFRAMARWIVAVNLNKVLMGCDEGGASSI